MSWIALGGTYGVSKAALASATDSMRLELAPRGVLVVGVYVGYVDTDMVAAVEAPKVAAADVVRQVLDADRGGAVRGPRRRHLALRPLPAPRAGRRAVPAPPGRAGVSAPDGVLAPERDTDREPDRGPDRVPARAWRVMAVTAAGVFVVFLDATVVNIAFPALSADFADATRADLSWVLNGYAVMFGALLVTAGRLADARGRRAVFLTGLVVFGLASALCGLAPSVALLVAARVVQGIGAALLVPASLALLLPEFPASRRAGAVGLWGAAGGVAAADRAHARGAARRGTGMALGLPRQRPLLPRGAARGAPGPAGVARATSSPGRSTSSGSAW